jgi:hypothetical protein
MFNMVIHRNLLSNFVAAGPLVPEYEGQSHDANAGSVLMYEFGQLIAVTPALWQLTNQDNKKTFSNQTNSLPIQFV